MTPSEIRAKEQKEWAKMLEEKRQEKFALHLQWVTGQLAKNAELRKVRKDVARLLTVMREKELGIGKVASAAEAEPAEKKHPAKKEAVKKVSKTSTPKKGAKKK